MKLTKIELEEFTKYLDFFNFEPYLKGKVFLITGAKGIIGSGIVKWFLLENQLRHTGLRIYASTRNPDAIPEYIEKSDAITYCEFGQEKIEQKIDYIIHAAAPTSNKVFMESPVESLRVIIDETEKMLELAQTQGSSFLYLSSEEAYGLPNSDCPIDEAYVGAIDSLNIRSCYPLGKKTAELLCKCFFQEYGTSVKIIRPTVIQGLLQKYETGKIENEILRCIIENKCLKLKSDGSTKKSMVYSLDAISAILTVLFKGKAGEAYNVTNPATYRSVKELAEYLFDHFNPELKVILPERNTSVTEGYLPKRTLLEDISKIQALGWQPLTGLEHIYRTDIGRFGKDKREEDVSCPKY